MSKGEELVIFQKADAQRLFNERSRRPSIKAESLSENIHTFCRAELFRAYLQMLGSSKISNRVHCAQERKKEITNLSTYRDMWKHYWTTTYMR